jgi:plastocyanin
MKFTELIRLAIMAFCLTSLGSTLPGARLAVTVRAAAAHVRGIVRVGDKPAPNVVVWVDAPGAWKSTDAKPVIDQRNLAFYPRVLAVQVGTVVEFPNHDRVFHNVFSFLNGKRFDLGLYATGLVKHITFDQPGLSHLFCNIHPHMAAYIMVVESRFFAVSDETGRFIIRDLPPGTYTYHSWRPGGSVTSASAAIDPEAVWEVQ